MKSVYNNNYLDAVGAYSGPKNCGKLWYFSRGKKSAMFFALAFLKYFAENNIGLPLTLLGCNEEIKAVSCTASSSHSNGYLCNNAIDGNTDTQWATYNQGVGAWIKINFDKMHVVGKLKLKHRYDDKNEMFKAITLEFSSGTMINSILHMSIEWNEVILDDFTNTDFIKITATSVYGTTNNGFSEIQVFKCPTGT